MTFIIAEAGVNHNGHLSEAMELALLAKKAGADAVKFQLFKSQKLWGDDRIKHLELSFDDMTRLYEHCQQLGIEFMCTPFGVEELAFLKPMLKRVKIASGCLRRTELLEYAALTKLPVILSTGMSNLAEIDYALRYLSAVTLLHCTSSYPCAPQDVNLRAMDTMRTQWGTMCDIGYSDHAEGILAALAAVAKGAAVLEKHLTIDRLANGPDHMSSVDPLKFGLMVDGIREIEQILGDGLKRVRPCEQALRAQWK